MCTGVTRGLAGMKLSGSIKEYGAIRLMKAKPNRTAIKVTRSLTAKKGWNETKPAEPETPRGLEAPLSWISTK